MRENIIIKSWNL